MNKYFENYKNSTFPMFFFTITPKPSRKFKNSQLTLSHIGHIQFAYCSLSGNDTVPIRESASLQTQWQCHQGRSVASVTSFRRQKGQGRRICVTSFWGEGLLTDYIRIKKAARSWNRIFYSRNVNKIGITKLSSPLARGAWAFDELRRYQAQLIQLWP